MGVKSRLLSVVSCQLKSLVAFLIATTGLVIGGCAGTRPASITRIALLAPFEGRYREVGYDAFYAVRLAIQDSELSSVEMLAVDDGGTTNSAIDRARALAGDPRVQVVIALGNAASQPETQTALGEKPMLIVGQWGTTVPEDNHVFILEGRAVSEILTNDPALDDVTQATQIDFPVVGNEVLALKQFPLLSNSTEFITVVSSASLPDTTFKERYKSSAEFVPEPGLLTTLTYDATRVALQAISHASDVLNALANTDYEGINGHIRFENGYWADAPIHCYGYNHNGELAAKDCPVE